jgi:hypothetical protein
MDGSKNPMGDGSVAGESLVCLASRKRAKHIAQLLGIDFETALEYCKSLEVQ